MEEITPQNRHPAPLSVPRAPARPEHNYRKPGLSWPGQCMADPVPGSGLGPGRGLPFEQGGLRLVVMIVDRATSQPYFLAVATRCPLARELTARPPLSGG